MRIAAKVRQEKEQHPERFCIDRRCLWRVQTRSGFMPCPKHMRTSPAPYPTRDPWDGTDEEVRDA